MQFTLDTFSFLLKLLCELKFSVGVWAQHPRQYLFIQLLRVFGLKDALLFIFFDCNLTVQLFCLFLVVVNGLVESASGYIFALEFLCRVPINMLQTLSFVFWNIPIIFLV